METVVVVAWEDDLEARDAMWPDDRRRLLEQLGDGPLWFSLYENLVGVWGVFTNAEPRDAAGTLSAWLLYQGGVAIGPFPALSHNDAVFTALNTDLTTLETPNVAESDITAGDLSFLRFDSFAAWAEWAALTDFIETFDCELDRSDTN